jgi:hypothetical protein
MFPPSWTQLQGAPAAAADAGWGCGLQGEAAGSLGECPFTQKANMALRSKKVQFDSKMIDMGAKPDWFLKLNEKGTAPTFVVADGKTLTDSEDIITWLDETVPEGGKLKGDAGAAAVWDAGSKVFSSFAAFLKNADAAQDGALRGAFKAELAKLETALASRPAGLLGGDRCPPCPSARPSAHPSARPSARPARPRAPSTRAPCADRGGPREHRLVHEDCRLAPFLFHVSAAMPHFKGEDALAASPACKAYLDAVRPRVPFVRFLVLSLVYKPVL